MTGIRPASVGHRRFDAMWSDLEPIGRDRATGGYRRYAWTPADAELREWFVGEAAGRGLDVVTDRNGNLWAWWGDPDRSGPGVVLGSHLDSVPDGGAYDGPLGIVSAFAAIDELRARGAGPGTPVGVAAFADEEGARFGVACAGSRLLTGALTPDRARTLVDADGVSLADAMTRSGLDPRGLGPDQQTLSRIGTYVELHIEQGRGLVGPADGGGPVSAAVGVGDAIWPHGRWRFDLLGQANHAGTTRLTDRLDPMLALARLIQAARAGAASREALATVAKVTVEPNGVNAIPSAVRAWLDARGPVESDVLALVVDLAAELGVEAVAESWTGPTAFDQTLVQRLSATLGHAPILSTGAGHDAGILAAAGVSTAMLYVRNPTGISHSPAESAERPDIHAGIDALVHVVQDLVPAS